MVLSFHALDVCQELVPDPMLPMQGLARAIVNGVEALESIPGCDPLRAAAQGEAWRLLRETALRITASMPDVLDACAGLSWTPPSEPRWVDVWAERHFLAGFAANRIDEAQRCERHWKCARDVRVSARTRRSLDERIALEAAISRLNAGFDRDAFYETRALLDSGGLDMITRVRALAVHGLAAGTLGALDEMDAALAEEKRILDVAPSPALMSAWKRRRSEGFLLRGHYKEALTWIDEGLAETRDSPSLQALFLNQKVETLILRNELGEAESLLAILDGLLAAKALPSNVLSLAQHRCELALRRKDSAGARASAIPVLEADARNVKLEARMHALEVQARLFLLEGAFEESEATLAKARDIARDQGYLPRLVDQLFHAAGVAFQRRDALAVRRHLMEARDIAKRLRLDLKVACFDTIIARLREPHESPSLRPLVLLLARGTRVAEIVYLLSHYGFGLNISRRLSVPGEASRVIREETLWEEWIQREEIYWIARDGLLLHTSFKKTGVADLKESPVLQRCVSAFIRNGGSLSLEEVHALTSDARYHPLRHAEKSRSLMSRMRKAFAEAGIEIARDPDRKVYTLTQPRPIIWVEE